MRAPVLFVVLALLCPNLPGGGARACTAFQLEIEGEHLVGKSYDWHRGEGLLIVNQRGVAKAAFLGHLMDRPARWTSRYGSLTFNQYGREMPAGGINEAGLVVEVLWLAEAEVPEPDERPSVNELQWIQWALDNHTTVAELVEAAPSIRVSPLVAAVHYFACDATGECAALEYLFGRLEIAAAEDMPIHALTNDTYDVSLSYAERFEGFGGILDPAGGDEPLDRFVTAATMARLPRGAAEAPEDAAFAVLDHVSMGPFTKWAIVYRPSERQVTFRTNANPTLRSVDLDDFDLDCGSPVQILDIDADIDGNATDAFGRYRLKTNRKLLQITLREFDVGVFFDAMVGVMAAYPGTTRCTP